MPDSTQDEKPWSTAADAATGVMPVSPTMWGAPTDAFPGYLSPVPGAAALSSGSLSIIVQRVRLRLDDQWNHFVEYSDLPKKTLAFPLQSPAPNPTPKYTGKHRSEYVNKTLGLFKEHSHNTNWQSSSLIFKIHLKRIWVVEFSRVEIWNSERH